MKLAKRSEILLGYKFTKSFYFKLWRFVCKLKQYINPNWYQKYNSKSQKYSYYSMDWIKKIITPSKAFKLWVKLHTAKEITQQTIFLVGKKYLPTKVKLFLKKNIPSYFPTTINPIPKGVRLEWDKWHEVRKNESLDIINFAVIPFEYRIQRPQHLLRELTELGHRAFYIESEFTYAPNIKQAKFLSTKKSHNLYAIKLSTTKDYFIYSDEPSIKDKNILIASLKMLLKEAHIVNPVAKIDHPFWASIANELGMPIVYDVMDLHSGFKETSPYNLNNEKKLLVKSDLILASSDYLQQEFRQYASKIVSLKNAGEYTHFSQASSIAKSKLPTPQFFKKLSRPIIGYYGALADWLNTDLIESLAQDFPEASIVLIGLVNNAKLFSLAKKYPNIYLLGEKPYRELPRYLAMFDVCLIPFKLSKLIKATNPVKIYEYFASGKPVVSTSIPELIPYRKMIYFGDDPRSYTLAVKNALAEKSSSLAKARMTVARTNTWSQRALTLQNHLWAKLYPKVSVIILTYNHPHLSKASIDTTLYRSKYPNLELIIVDNKSHPETIRMLKKYQNMDNTKVVFNPVNYGFAKGNNIGMKKTTGEFIILLNNDVRVTPGWIERLVYHAKGKGIGLVGPVTNSIGNESKIEIVYDPEDQKEIEHQAAEYTYAHWQETLQLRNIAAFAWIMSRSTYRKIGNLDERFGMGLLEDDDYCMRVKQAKLHILCAEDAFIHHYGGASTTWGSPEFQLLFETNKDKFEKKWKTKWVPHQHRKK